jgi:hypothetical protein
MTDATRGVPPRQIPGAIAPGALDDLVPRQIPAPTDRAP